MLPLLPAMQPNNVELWKCLHSIFCCGFVIVVIVVIVAGMILCENYEQILEHFIIDSIEKTIHSTNQKNKY